MNSHYLTSMSSCSASNFSIIMVNRYRYVCAYIKLYWCVGHVLCIYRRWCSNIYTHIYVCVWWASMYVCLCECMHASIHVYMHPCIYVCRRTCMYACILRMYTWRNKMAYNICIYINSDAHSSYIHKRNITLVIVVLNMIKQLHTKNYN